MPVLKPFFGSPPLPEGIEQDSQRGDDVQLLQLPPIIPEPPLFPCLNEPAATSSSIHPERNVVESSAVGWSGLQEVSVIHASSRSTAPPLGNLLGLHRRREPQYPDDASVAASDGVDEDDIDRSSEVALLDDASVFGDNVAADEWEQVIKEDKLTARFLVITPHVKFMFLILEMLAGGIVLIVLPYCFPDGWQMNEMLTQDSLISHYLCGPHLQMIIFMVVISALKKEDSDARKHQPLMDLMKGNAKADQTLLLDYTSQNPFSALYNSLKNRHWQVSLGVIVGSLATLLNPLTGAILIMQPHWSMGPHNTTMGYKTIGLNEGPSVTDLTAFLNAANYVTVDITFGVGDPHWVHQGYAIADFELPKVVNGNGTLHAETIAIFQEPGCTGYDAGSMSMIPFRNKTGWANSVSFDGCEFQWVVDDSAKDLYGVGTIPYQSDCKSSMTLPQEHQPVVFWFFTHSPRPMLDAVMCTPAMSVWSVVADVDLYTGKLTGIHRNASLASSSFLDVESDHVEQLASLRNLSGYPMYGRAYNGVFFGMNITDTLVQDRLEGLQMMLPAAMYKGAGLSEQGLIGAFRNGFAGFSNRVYGMYLSIVSRSIYFVDTPQPIPITIRISAPRLRLTPRRIPCIILGITLIISAILALTLKLLSLGPRSKLAIGAPLGTLASYMSLGLDNPLQEYLLEKRKLGEDELGDELKRMRLGFGYYVNGTRRIVCQKSGVPIEKGLFERVGETLLHWKDRVWKGPGKMDVKGKGKALPERKRDLEEGDPALEALKLRKEDRPCWICLAGRCVTCSRPILSSSESQAQDQGQGQTGSHCADLDDNEDKVAGWLKGVPVPRCACKAKIERLVALSRAAEMRSSMSTAVEDSSASTGP